MVLESKFNKQQKLDRRLGPHSVSLRKALHSLIKRTTTTTTSRQLQTTTITNMITKIAPIAFLLLAAQPHAHAATSNSKPNRLRGLRATTPQSSLALDSSSEDDKPSEGITLYIIRHGEQMTSTTPLGAASKAYDLSWEGDKAIASPRGKAEGSVDNGEIVGQNFDQVCGNRRCAEELDRMGLLRADLLALWMKQEGILSKLTAVFASHLRRTAQTVMPLASMAGLEVQQYPRGASELNPEGGGASVCPTVAAIKNAEPGSTIVVAAHTSTIYRILGEGNGDECEGLGLDTSDPASFPRDDRGAIPRDQYGNVWKVFIDTNTGDATLEDRQIVEFSLGSVSADEYSSSSADEEIEPEQQFDIREA